MRTALLVVLAVLAALAAGWYMGARRSSAEIEALAVLPPVEVPAQRVSPAPVATRDVDAELEELIKPRPAPSEAAPAPVIPAMPSLRGQRVAHLDQVVDPGSTLVTEAYEVQPGVFNYSTLTPRLSVLEDGAAGVQMDVKRYQFDVSGGYYVDFDKSLPLLSGSDSGISFQEADQGYASILRVELQPDSGQIRVMATDYKTEGATSTPPGSGESAPGDVP